MKDKYLVRKSRKFRKVFGFVGAIQLAKIIERREDIEEILSVASKYGAIHTGGQITGVCPSDGGYIGYIIFSSASGKHSCRLEYDCCGFHF